MKKILHISNYYAPHIGGIEDMCHSIVSALPEFEHQVICFTDEKQTVHDLYEGVKITRSGVWKKLFSQPVSFSFYKELKKVLKEFDPDFIHFHAPNPLGSVYLLAQLPKKVKLIVHWHSDIVEQKILHTLYIPFERCLLKRANQIVATSMAYAQGSKPLVPWKDKIIAIPSTVKIDLFQKRTEDEPAIDKIKQQYGGKKIIFTFGRHVTYKGLQYLIEAAPSIVSDAVIVIAGKGPLTNHLKELAKNSSSIYFIGRLDDDTLRHYLYASDLFAFPSITRNEAYGLALAEAMYCGLPAVTFTIPRSGVNWVCLNGETGLESENKNVEALAGSINQLIKDDALRAQLSVNASKRVQTLFVMSAVKENLVTLYS
ncbi:mannosyltransferase [Bacteroidia bacterium]|nr:mannosyltransferase [Bacteroidia bacterium]